MLNKSNLKLAAVILTVLCLFSVLIFHVVAATVASGNGTWVSGKLTYTWAAESNGTTSNGATGTVSASGNKLTVTATNSKEVSGCSTTAAEATTTTVTVTNASSYPLKITTLTTSGSASVSGVSQGDTIASGATFKVTVFAPAVSSSTKVSGTVTIAVEEKNTVNVTLASSPYVGYTVDGHTVAQDGSNVTFEKTVGASISLPSITAPSGYEFKGWRIGSSMTNASSFTADSDYTVFPVIVTEGTDVSAANFKVGSNTYTFWEDAMTAAVSGDGKLFVNLTEVTLPANVLDNLLSSTGGTYVKPVTGGGVEYILPSGVMLVLPYSTSTTVHTTAPAYGYKARVTPSPFRTLTVPNGAKITVNGSVSVDSYVCAYGQSNQGNGTPSGPHGKIVMKTGSEMTFNSGAFLYCWGYINGDGNIYMKSGAKVYELFQFCDWRGGNGTNDINGNSQRVFPMSQYYVQNVEAPMRIYKGATEYVWSVVNMSSSAYPVSAFEFIGTNGMFKLTGGSSDYVMKRYHANVDQLEITAHGDMSLNNLTVKVSGLPLIGTITMNSSDYVLPINNINIVVETGTTSIASSQTYGVEFLPSSKLTVNEGATFSVNAPVYFYDADDWGGYVGASNLKLVVSGYSTANGTTTMRTADNLKDAELNVNGTVNVSNKLYTTEHGANITSSAGTGVINFTTACATSTATTYQATQSGSSISAYPAITVNNAWLKNGDESYSKTVGTGTSTWYYDGGSEDSGNHWYRYLVDFYYKNNFIGRDYYCENNDTVTYDASWVTVDLGAGLRSGTADVGVSGTDVNVTNVTVDSAVNITGTAGEYTPTFVLNAKQYSIYCSYTGNTISNTTTIGGETYYIVHQAPDSYEVGTAYSAPTDESMGVTAANHNTITWNMSGISATSGDPYLGTVPRGESNGGPTYIYGFYTGVVAHNSWNDQYYDTLIGAFSVLPQDVSATITLLLDCGTFEEESGTIAYTAYPSNNITLDLNGHHAVGRIVSSGTFTLDLNGGTLDFHTGATAAAATWKGLATIINSGTMTVRDTVGGGVVTTDAISNTSGTDGSAVIRNNAGATLTVTGKASNNLLTLAQTQNVNGNNYGIFNLGTISALTNADISTVNSGTTGLNVYNYNTGVITLISGGHMFCSSNCSIFNYGSNITTINGLTIDGKNGIVNRNIVSGAIASGYSVTDANKGIIGTISNCTIEVGQYAINNHAVINTLSNSTFIAHPDSAQVDTRGNGLSTASETNVQCYTIVNNNDWWYNTNVWKQVDSSSGGYTRVNYYKEEEQYRPTIGTITNCNIYAELTSTSASHGYALTNYGVIGKISGTTNIKAYKHPDNAKISVGHYAMHNLGGGIIKSIEGAVFVSATGVGTVYNDGQFTLQNNYTYANKVGGNITYQKNTYGEPSTIQSITCSGTWSCGGSSSYYYALMNSGYIGTINSTGLKLEGGYNVLYNATGSANKTYEINRYYTDGATASTEYKKVQTYVKNLEKGSTIGSINGITVTGKGTKSYYPFNNQGHIGTLSNVTVNFAEGATANTSYYVAFLNGDSRYKEYTETIQTNRTAETDPHLTVSAGIVTRYDRDYTYTLPPTIDTIDNLTVNSITLYAFRNAGHIGTLKNSTITGTQYALHNSDSGPYTERQSEQYYSGTSIFATTKGSSDLSNHYKKNASSIDLIDNCTITTPASTYAMLNGGHVGTIKNSTFTAGTTTAKAYALSNTSSTIREYTRDLSDIVYITANGGTSCTTYYGSGGETNVVVYDYDAPVIDLIGEGNTFTATAPTIANTGIITEINSGTGALTTITSSAAKNYAIYNYSANLDTRTTTTPYTAATAASTSGTAGTAVNSDTLQPGATIGTIKNVFINANGYGILNGDASAGKCPTIGEIGEGTEIYAHCTTAAYHAIYNQANAKVTSITGGVYTTTKATTNAYKNNNTDPALATVITGGDFKGMAVGRTNAIFEPDNTNRQTYGTPEQPMTLSATSHSVDFNNGTTVASGTGYYPVVNVYTVTFDMQGHGTAPDPQTVENGLKATQPADPSAEDWIFGGWYKEAACTNAWNFSTDTVTADTTIYAKWTQTFTVTFDKNGHGNDVAPIEDITPNTTISAPATPVVGSTVTDSEGKFRFDGWYTESGCTTPFDFSSAINANTTLFAKWTALYTVTFNANEHGTAPTALTDIVDGSTITAPTAPTATGYQFSGWYKEEACTNAWNFSTDTVTADTTLFAKWTCTVTFDANGHGTAPSAQTGIVPGSKIGVPSDATAERYDFSGWYKEAACTNAWNFSTDTVTADTTLYAKWTCTVTFNANGHGTAPDAVSGIDPGSTIPAPSAPSEAGYRFDGWFKEEGCTNAWNFSTDTVTVNTTLYAKWVKVWTITWVDGNNNTLKTEQVDEGTTPNYTGTTPTKTADAQYTYNFNGTWLPVIVPATADATYKAQFDSTVNKYTITWVDGNGNTLKTDTVAYGQTPAYVGDTPTKTATAQYTYTFNNTWSPAVTSVTGAATYTAQFDSTVNKYDITWKDGDGNTLKTEQVEYGETPSYTGATPTKTATAQYTYEFNNTWSPAVASVAKAATYTAQFDATIRKYTVTWMNGSSTLETDTEVPYGTAPSYNGEEPTKAATDQYTYTFAGWAVEDGQESGTAAASLPTVGGNTTYYAAFSKTVNKYTIRFVNYDGEELQSSEVDYGATPVYSGANPKKTSTNEHVYSFIGWDEEIGPVTGAKTYTAQYEEGTRYYTITWVIDGVSTEETYVYNVMPTHADPVKPNTDQAIYTFTGWSPELAAVTADATYTAQFSSVATIAKIGDDRYPSLKAAVAAASAGDTIVLVADDDVSLTDGSELVINKSLTITGATDAKGNPLYTVYGTSNQTGNNDIFITGNGEVTLENLKIKNFGDEAATDIGHAPLYVSTSFTGTVNFTNLYVNNFNRGGMFLYGGEFNVTDCYIDCANSRSGAFTKGIEIKGTAHGTISDTFICNMERASASYMPAGIEVYGSGDVTVDGCTIISDDGDHAAAKETYGIVIAPVGAYVPGDATLTVTDTMMNTTNGALSVDADNYNVELTENSFDNYMATWNAGSTITINSGDYCEDVYADAGTIYIHDGEFSNFAPDTGATGHIVIDGGLFDAPVPEQYCAEDYIPAVYDEETGLYTVIRGWFITFVNYDGTTVLDRIPVPAGDTPEYTGETPVKPSTVDKVFTFSGWDPTIVPAVAEATYTAQYTESVRKYTITWVDGDGNTLYEEDVDYGATPSYSGETPTETSTAQYDYEFNETWSPAIVPVAGDATYTAQFTPIVRKYAITWIDGDGNELTTEEVEYGTLPSYSGTTPTKSSDIAYSYTFNNTWSPEIVSVVGEATYTAQFDSAARVYSLKLNYQTHQSGSNPKDYDNTGAKIKFTYPGTIQEPTIQYYTLAYWTINGEGHYSTAELPVALKSAIDTIDDPEDNITVKAFFERKTYKLEIYSIANGDMDHMNLELEMTCNVGRTIWINGSAEIDGGLYKFDHWVIDNGTPDIGSDDTNDKSLRTSYWRGEVDGDVTVKAYAYYTNQGGSDTSIATPKVTVRDYFTENNNGVYVVGMTLEVIAPSDMDSYAVATDSDGKCRIGFGFTTDADDAAAGKFSERLSSGWNPNWISGTYVVRFQLPNADARYYTYGFLDYTINGGAVQHRYATHDHQNTAELASGDYDTMSRTGRVTKGAN